MKFDILNRFSGEVQITAEIECDDCENLNPCHWALAWGYASEEGSRNEPSETRRASFTSRENWHFEEGRKQYKRERQDEVSGL